MKALIEMICQSEDGIKESRFIFEGKIMKKHQIISIIPNEITPERVLHSDFRELTETCPQTYFGVPRLSISDVRIKRNENIEYVVSGIKNDIYKTSRKLIKDGYRVKIF